MTSLIQCLEQSDHPCRIAVTGLRHVGKTTRLCEYYRELAQARISCGGFIERAIFENDHRIGYDFESLVNRDHITVARKNTATGKYDFNPEAWSWADRQLVLSETQKVLIVDELGLLESKGGGQMPCLKASLMRKNRHLIASVRLECLNDIARQTGAWDLIIELRNDSVRGE